MRDTALCYSSVKSGFDHDAIPRVVLMEAGMVSTVHFDDLSYLTPSHFEEGISSDYFYRKMQ